MLRQLKEGLSAAKPIKGFRWDDGYRFAQPILRRCHRTGSRHHPRKRVIQYSRDASHRIEKPRRTGYSAFAEYDELWGRMESLQALYIFTRPRSSSDPETSAAPARIS